MYTNDTPEIRRAWWSELGMNRIFNRMIFQIHPQGFISGVNMNGISFEFAPRTVRRHEFEVSLWCVSDDEFFQALEFGLVERELIQAVGRARLLENDVEVRVWSNYVLSGGEVWLNPTNTPKYGNRELLS